MNYTTIKILVLGVLLSGMVFGGVVEEADQLFKQGKYREAGEKLYPEISVTTPSAPAIVLAVDIALASGDTIQAGRLATTLFKRYGETDPAMLLKSAETAKILGLSKVAAVRYLSYATRSDAKDEKFRDAARYVFSTGPYTDLLKKYLTAFPNEGVEVLYSDELIRNQIHAVLDDLWQINSIDAALDLTEQSLDYFRREPTMSQWVFEKVYNNSKFIVKPEDVIRVLKIVSKYRYANLDRIVAYYRDVRYLEQPEDDVVNGYLLEALKTNKDQTSGELVWGNDTFPDLNRMKPEMQLEFAKFYLEVEPIYKNEERWWDYQTRYVERIAQFKSAFRDTQLVSPARFQAMVDELVAKYKGDPLLGKGRLGGVFGSGANNYFDNDNDRGAFLGRYVAYLPESQNNNRLNDYIRYAGTPETINSIVATSFPVETVDTKYAVLNSYHRLKLYREIPKIVTEHAIANPHYWSPDQAWNYLFSRPDEGDNLEFPVAVKLQVLNLIFANEGRSKPLDSLLENLKKNGWDHKPEFVQFENAYKGSKPIIKRPDYDLAQKIFREGDNAKVEGLSDEFLKHYTGPIPAERKFAKTPMELLAYGVYEHCRYRLNDRVVFVDRWAPRFKGPGNFWDVALSEISRYNNSDLWKYTQQYLDVLKRSNLPPGAAAESLGNARPPKEEYNQPLFTDFYKQMGQNTTFGYICGQAYYWDDAIVQREYAKMTSLFPMDYKSMEDFRRNVVERARQSSIKLNSAQTQQLVGKLIDLSIKENRVDYEAEGLVFSKLVRSENLQEIENYVQWYLGKISYRPSAQQLKSLCEVVFQYFANFSPAFYVTVTIPKVDAIVGNLAFGEGEINGNLLNRLNWLVTSDQSTASVEEKQAISAFRDRLFDGLFLKSLQAYSPENNNVLRDSYRDRFVQEIPVAKNWTGIISGLGQHVGFILKEPNWVYVRDLWINPVVKSLEDAGKNEMTYTFAYNFMEDYVNKSDPDMQSTMSIIRSKASKGIEGLIPVATSDPAYNLYLASQYLDLGNEERAWQLIQPKLDLLKENWEKMDVGFNAWAAEQMRKQKMLNEALNFCLVMLVKEYDIDVENAASVMLVKGDVYRDMNNNPAAKMEYQGLVSNKRYLNTPAGRLAKYRLIEIMIQTKEYSSAEAQLERLVDIGSIEEQADANYYFAKIAFEQGDAEAAAGYLAKCFKLLHGHVKGRLLEGELKLILPRGLEDPEVQVGRLDLQTVVIPGKSLKLKLQDNNLSIARGGKSIPVVVVTSSGDEEKVDLFASSSDTTLFSGTIQTGLGAPIKGNLLLEVNGNDEVSYIIDPEFQKANDISYPRKVLVVKSDARLVASSGEILTEEEEERRELQRRMVMTQAGSSKRLTMRNNKTVRPGSAVYVELTDFDQDITGGKDKVLINIETASGDLLSDYALEESAAHSGVFKGMIQTGLPFPLVVVSSGDESLDPNSVINSKKSESWKSLGDGIKPKWIEVDTMNSYEFKEIDINCKNPEMVKSLFLFGVLADDRELIAKYPKDQSSGKGGLAIVVTRDGSSDPNQIRRLIQYKGEETYSVSQPIFNRQDTKFKSQEWLIASMKGFFYAPESREVTMRVACPEVQRNDQGCFLSFDGKYIWGNFGMSATDFDKEFKVFLKKGVHEVEFLIRNYLSQTVMTLEYRKEDGAFEPLPADWFSITRNNELAELLRPKGVIQKTETGFKAILTPAKRFRKFRWVFDEFLSTIIEVDSISAVDSKGNPILPVDVDFTTGRANDKIEVSAGDEITITYKDVKRTNEDMPEKEAQLNSSFANADVELSFEKVTFDEHAVAYSTYSKAKRIRKGDQLMLIVTDYDEDTTDNRDTIQARVSTTRGETLVLDLLETGMGNHEGVHDHAGRFMQTLKFGDATGGNTIKIAPEDRVTVSYLDRENTDPGIPFERTYSLEIEERDNPGLTIFKTDVKLIEDKSTKALNKIRAIQIKQTAGEDMKMMKEQITATSMSPDELGEALAINVMSPMLFELSYPKMAMHADSTMNVAIISDSEIAAAAKEGRVAVTNEIPVYIRNLVTYANSKGFSIRTKDIPLFDREEMLERGLFAGVVRLQIGSPGDPINHYIENESSDFLTGNQIQQFNQNTDQYTVPTIVVAGSDTITLMVRNDKGESLVEKRVRLLADGRLELLDGTYSAPVNGIHLGQKFYLRLTDPDQDTTDDKDEISVKVTSDSQDELQIVLKETLPHSGTFSGTVLPAFIEKDATGNVAPDKSDSILRVNFGDQVQFVFSDNLNISSKEPLVVSAQGFIYKGADGQLASFTKSFKDPDMAVKTRFLMAEARFEVAKEYRKLKKDEEAETEIANGKRILEEAMRDYPNTTLKAQGEFLLANLSQELGKYQEAIGRYSNVINNWPTSEYAIRSQLKKAICLEELQMFDQACEEYVKLTYLYPDSQYVAEASIRMANYYYKHKQYGIAAQIFLKFQKKNPTHELAPKSLFLAANCFMRLEKENEEAAHTLNPQASGDYSEAIRVLEQLLNEYKDDKELCAEAMYWLGDCLSNDNDYKKAYQTFKKLTWDYPETKWAKIARGRLTDERFTSYEEE